MRYAFADCVLDTTRHELHRAGELVKLQRKVYHVLVYLVEHRDHLVTKEELLKHVWPDVYVADYAVARSIAAARRAVGDSATGQRLIQTRHGQGYRFVAPVAEEVLAPTSAETASGPILAPLASPGPVTVSGGVGAGERKLVTVLGCQWTPAPSLAARLDLDGLHEMLRAVESLVRHAVEPYGGVLRPLASDRGEVFFGAPVAQEDHALRAVLAALAVRRQWQELPVELGLPSQEALTLQLGVHTGPMVVEEREGDAPHHVSVTGEVPILTAALAQQTPPGTIVVSNAVARLLPEEVRLEEAPPLRVIGQPTSVAAYRVVGYEPGRGLGGRLGKERRSRFVGRHEELAVLHSRLLRVDEGQGQAVGIVGEPGMGKTRILAEFRQEVTGRPITYLAGRCQSYGSATPYLPLAHLLRQYWGLTDTESPAVCRARVRAELQSAGLETEAAVAVLLDLLGLPETTDQHLSIPPQRHKAQTFATLHHLFVHSSQNQPLVIEVENLHWIDPSTEEYLAALVTRLSGARILLLATYRPGYQPSWLASSIATQIALTPLTQRNSLHLVQSALRHQPLEDALAREIVAKAGGNPLFLEELALTVAEEGETALTPRVPDTVQAVLAARLDRLPPTAKHLLQTAAVIGTDVPLPLLQALVTLPEETLTESLTQLQASEFLFETRLLPVPTYTFKHALTQEAAYQSLLRRTRQQVHAQIVQTVIAQFPELAETQPERLAHHATEAGLHAQAVGYWQRAGERAVERSANVEAIAHLNKGLEMLQMLPATPVRTQHDLALHVALGAALLMTKGHAAPEVAQTYAQAHALCQQVEATPQLAPVLLGLWRFALVRATLGQARGLSEQLLALAQRLQDPSLLVLAHYASGVTLFWCGELVQARTHLEAGTVHYDPRQHHALAFHSGQDPGVACLAFAARALWLLGYPDQALQRSHLALRCAQELAHPFSEAFARTFLGYIALRRREWSAAQAHAEAIMAQATTQGFPFWGALSTIQRGYALAAQGQPEAGLTQMYQGVAAWRATGAGLGEPLFLGFLAEIHGQVGQSEAGLRLLTTALAAVEATGEWWCEAELYRLKGELLLTQSPAAPAEAETCLQHARTLAQRQQARSWELRATLSLSRLWHSQGKRNAARHLLQETYSRFREGWTTGDLTEAKAFLDTPV